MTSTVSIIVPCYNEQATIRKLLEAIRAQTYPRHKMEVIISDGLSTDDTRNVIAAFQAQFPDLPVRIVDNTARSIPAALNRAIQTAQGEIILRLDAHSMPYPDYVAGCVRALEEGRGANVGGVWDVRAGAPTWIAESIAKAAAHPLGVGDAMYRLSPQAGLVDTVPFGSFYRSLVEEIGPFDETLLSNEDYEFNARVRRSGRIVWLDPSIQSIYFARPTLTTLAQQYWRYGFWKWRMLQRYPSTIRWRQALPPLFVLSLAGSTVLSFWFVPALFFLIAEMSIYLAILFLAGIIAAFTSPLTPDPVPLAVHGEEAAARPRREMGLIAGLPLAILTMHLAWGGGFLWSMISGFAKK